MFGAKYSRMKFWIISILLFIPSIVVITIKNSLEAAEKYDMAMNLYIVTLILGFIWVNTLANRIRDYGGNPWLSLLALIPLGNIILALYYGIVQYKDNPEKSTGNNQSNPSLTKAVINHTKDTACNIKPMVNDYIEKHTSRECEKSIPIIDTDLDNTGKVDEDAIYEKVMLEIEEDNKVKATWARALSQSDGDKDKAESIYITSRVEKIKSEQQNYLNNKSNINTTKKAISTNTISEKKHSKLDMEKEIKIINDYEALSNEDKERKIKNIITKYKEYLSISEITEIEKKYGLHKEPASIKKSFITIEEEIQLLDEKWPISSSERARLEFLINYQKKNSVEKTEDSQKLQSSTSYSWSTVVKHTTLVFIVLIGITIILEYMKNSKPKPIEKQSLIENLYPTHKAIERPSSNYKEVKSPYTGKIWLDKNIGAKRPCKSYDDIQCFGNYYTWDNRNVCPKGFRVPTIDELKNETINQNINNRYDVANSFLKLPSAGYIPDYVKDIETYYRGIAVYLWSSSEYNNEYAKDISFDSTGIYPTHDRKGDRMSIRCIKDKK